MATSTVGTPSRPWTLPPASALTVFVGNFGSGKTEVAINYATALAASGHPVKLVDLDIINLFFRSREARARLAEQGVEVIAPENEYTFADLPILLREVLGSVIDAQGFVVLDVGGDDLGARVLGSLAPSLRLAKAQVLQVVNQRRPFTDSLAGCQRMYDELEAASRLKVAGLVANTHLIDETTAQVVAEGVAFTRDFAQQIQRPLLFAAVDQRWSGHGDVRALGCPLLAIKRYMTSPWDPSTRRGPIGRPPTPTLPAGVK